MLIAITTISIFAITGFVWLVNRILPLKICPICAGVSGTWLWLLAAKFLGYEIDLLIPAILMGGSVVGIANRLPLPSKTLFISVGFVAVYSVLASWWTAFIVATTILVIVALRFTEEPRAMEENGKVAAPSGRASPHEMRREELEKKMKKCC